MGAPRTPLPDAPLATRDTYLGTIFDRRKTPAKPGFDARPATSIVAVAFGQPPQAMPMIRQNHDRDHLEWLCMSRRSKRCTQIIDMIDQQTPPAFQQIHGEEERAARHMFAAITRHSPACQHHEARNIGKTRTQRRRSPQRMPHSRKVRPGAPYNKTPGILGRAPARRLYGLQAFP